MLFVEHMKKKRCTARRASMLKLWHVITSNVQLPCNLYEPRLLSSPTSLGDQQTGSASDPVVPRCRLLHLLAHIVCYVTFKEHHANGPLQSPTLNIEANMQRQSPPNF